MLKFITQYTLNNVVYPSEIFVPSWLDPLLIIDRQLPNEILTAPYQPITSDDRKTSAYYIKQNLYIDALHRLMYMFTIQPPRDLVSHLHDDGILHQLTHLKTNFSHPNIPNSSIIELCVKADSIEQHTSGSYLWAKHLTLMNVT